MAEAGGFRDCAECGPVRVRLTNRFVSSLNRKGRLSGGPGDPGPYLELFARRQRLGWDTWGNEALEHVELA